MDLVSFAEVNTEIAKDQDEYRTMPAHHSGKEGDEYGIVTCCWQPTWKERLAILFRGRIWHQVYTFNGPLQPQLLRTDSPFGSRDDE